MIILLGLLTYPVFSTTLLLVAGILIGYAVCYPFRTDASGVPEQLEQVQKQNTSLQAALEDQCHAYARLEQKYIEQHKEWTELRDSHNELTTAWEKFGADYSQVGSDLQRIQKVTNESAEAVKIERVERQVVEKALVQAEDTIDELRQQVAALEREKEDAGNVSIRLDEAHQQIEAVTQRLEQQTSGHAAELEKARGESARLSTELQSCQRQCVELDEALASQRRELTLAQSECVRLRNAETERTQLVSAIGARRDQVRELEAERDEARAAEHQIRRQWEETKNAADHRDSELARLREEREQRNAALEQRQQERQELEDTIAAHAALIQKLSADRDVVAASRQAAEKVQTQLEQQTRANKQLQARCHEALADLQREQAGRQEIESRLDESQAEISALRQRCLDFQNVQQEKERLQAALADGHRRLRQLTIERDAAFAAEVAAKETVAALETTTYDNAHDIDRIRKHREEVLAELESVKSDHTRLESELKHRDQKIATLQAACDRLAARKSDRDALAERLSKQAERLRKISVEHELASASLGQAEQTIGELRQLLESRTQRIEDLQRERDEVYHIGSQEVVPQPTQNTRIDARLGLIYLRTPEFTDDLKRISGVAEVLEKKLNDLGVYTYKQVMDWDDTAVEAFSELLAFKDRIARENWVGQARRLHAEAQGRAA